MNILSGKQTQEGQSAICDTCGRTFDEYFLGTYYVWASVGGGAMVVREKQQNHNWCTDHGRAAQVQVSALLLTSCMTLSVMWG